MRIHEDDEKIIQKHTLTIKHYTHAAPRREGGQPHLLAPPAAAAPAPAPAPPDAGPTGTPFRTTAGADAGGGPQGCSIFSIMLKRARPTDTFSATAT